MSRLVFPVTTADATRGTLPGGHFGRSKFYYVADLDAPENDFVLPNTSDHFGGVGSPIDLVASQNPSAMIALKMGQHARDSFQSRNIPVFQAERIPISDLITRYTQSSLPELTDLCDSKGEHHHH